MLAHVAVLKGAVRGNDYERFLLQHLVVVECELRRQLGLLEAKSEGC